MAQPRRNVSDQNAKLTRPADTRGSKGAIIVPITIAILLTGIAGIPGLHSKQGMVAPPTAVTQESRDAWMRIASDLMGVVPADILLGDSGANPHLDEKLREAQLDRDLFQRTALAIRAEFTRDSDAAEQEAIEGSLERLALPDRFQATANTDSAPRTQKYSSPAVKELMSALIACLVPDHEPEHP